MSRQASNNKGQAVAEMAVFGGLTLLILGTMLSFLQRFNDQQYVEMESFRRAQALACLYNPAGDGQGAGVQMTLIESRRHSDLSGDFRKGSPAGLSASSNVFWAVPEISEDAEAPSLIVVRVNEEETVRDEREFVPKEHDSVDDEGHRRQKYWAFEIEDINTDSKSEFSGTAQKQENTSGIINTNNSGLKSDIHTTVNYVVNERDKDDYDYRKEITSGVFFDVDQNLYRDTADGQYKYSSQAPEALIERASVWKTQF
jgi:hypothetical protein